MSNVVSTTIFCMKNTNKADNGDVGRGVVATAQVNNIFKAVSAYDNKVGKTTKAAVDAFEQISKENKAVAYAGKGLNFLSRNINPLICVSSGIQVLTSDDKERAGIIQGTALGTMFIGEGTMKNQFPKLKEYKGVDKLIKNIQKFAKKWHCEKGLPAVIKGLTFVTGSTLSYAVGEKLGKMTVKSIRNENVFEKDSADYKEEIQKNLAKEQKMASKEASKDLKNNQPTKNQPT